MHAPRMHEPDICVMIAAYRCEDTVGRAIASALAQPRVAEIIVVDDASPDGTLEAARRADDGTGRLRVLASPANGGPAAARNRALQNASARYVAVLDADDVMLDGRFEAMPDAEDWDFFCDNVVFVGHADAAVAQGPRAYAPLSFEQFVRGNISKIGSPRGELGFIKPVIRRAFLEKHAIRYDETLRLGEDLDLYARGFLAGARFLTSRRTGYGAVVRDDSLSASHSTGDLANLTRVAATLARDSRASPDERRALRRLARQFRARHSLRHFLDRKNAVGSVRALVAAATRPADFARVVRGVLRDKAAPLVAPAPPAAPRTLFAVNGPGTSHGAGP